jgi:hypothetical protein
MATKKLCVLLIVLLSMVEAKSFAYDIAVENSDGVTIYYNYINEGLELEVTNKDINYYENSYTGNVVIPEEVTYMNRTRKVVIIGERAFSQSRSLTSVRIPNSIKEISFQAFYGCQSLNSVTIGNSVTIIGQESFLGCRSLTSITLPSSLITISGSAFSGCNKLSSIIIPSNVATIGEMAFEDCSCLTHIYIGKSVKSIGKFAFAWCSGLTSVHITDLSAWCNISFGDNPLHYAHHLYMNDMEIKELVIPNDVTTIANGAFAGCYGFTSLIIPNSVQNIGIGAFSSCVGLSSVTIPNSVISIGENAFDGWDLQTIISMIEQPYAINGKQSDSRVFNLNTFNNATLYIPKGAKEQYKETEGWKDFLFIEEGTGDNPPSTQKCSTPTISYHYGKLTFNSDTEGVIFHSTVTDDDIKSYDGNEIQLGVSYNISVYATKEGYQNSEIATATLCWIDVEPKTEGITDGIAQMPARAVMVKAEGGQLIIEGADDNTNISVYNIDGVQLGTSTSRNGVALINTSIPKSSVTIVKIGNKSVKVMMK